MTLNKIVYRRLAMHAPSPSYFPGRILFVFAIRPSVQRYYKYIDMPKVTKSRYFSTLRNKRRKTEMDKGIEVGDGSDQVGEICDSATLEEEQGGKCIA